MILCFQTLAQNEIFVSPAGKDSNTGTKNNPVLTLKKAKEILIHGNSTKANFIYLREGEYRVTNTFSLNDNDLHSQLTISSYKNEKVTITGGISISKKHIESLSDTERNTFQDNARENIKKINLAQLGIADFGSIKNVGFQRPYSTAPLEIFINNLTFGFHKPHIINNIKLTRTLKNVA